MWWLPLVAAALSSVDEENKKAKERQDALDDTLNHIRQSHASRMGADPSLGAASNFATSLSRANRDYVPPTNAVGAAIQAIGKDNATGRLIQPLGPGSYADTAGGSYEVAPEQVLGGGNDELIDPWSI